MISHELLSAASADQAHRAVASLAPADVHVVLTVRDFATLLPAEWQETVKHRNTRAWEDWLGDVIDHESESTNRRKWWFWRVHDTVEIARLWSQLIPPERVHVITVPSRGAPQARLWERFAGLIGVDPRSVDTGRARSNQALGLAEIELLRRVNEALPDELPGWFYMRKVKDLLAHDALAGRGSSERLELPAERDEWTRQEAARVVAGLGTGGYDIVGDLDELQPRPVTGRRPAPTDVTTEQLLDAAVAAVSAVLVDTAAGQGVPKVAAPPGVPHAGTTAARAGQTGPHRRRRAQPDGPPGTTRLLAQREHRPAHPRGGTRAGSCLVTPLVYLHVGEPKCGTTFLQDVVWANRATLARQGLVLPGATHQDQFRAGQDLRGVVQAAGDPAGSWVGEWDIVASQARSAKGAALLSNELLAAAGDDVIERALRSLEPAEVHVVLTVRDPASLLPAEWQETIKHRNERSWRWWLASVIDRPVEHRSRASWFWQVHDTLDVLRRWSASLAPERVHVITVPPRGAPPQLLWQRFAGVIGVDATSVDVTTARPNASLGVAEVELLRRLNRRLDDEVPTWFYARHVKEALAHGALAQRPSGRRVQLPLQRAGWAQQHADSVIDGVRAAGFEVIGDLAELRPAPVSGPSVGPDVVTDAELLDASLDGLAALVRHQYEQTRPAGVPGRYRSVRWLRDASARHPSVARLRVLAWRISHRRSARSAVRTRR